MNRIVLMLIVAALLTSSGASHSQHFPVRPVRMVVGIGAGSSMDIVARLFGQKLSESWGEPVIIDNRPSAGGTMGADMVTKAAPDGYTLLFCGSSLAISASLMRKLPFDAKRDLEPVIQVSSRGNALVVTPSFPANSVKELIALAKAKPGQLTFGSGGGTGSGDHMAGELFKLLAGVDIAHIPYKSGPAALTDVINGQVTLYLGGLAVSLPMINAGKLKALGTSGARRSPSLPDVPTIAESGLSGYEVDVWYGILAPRGTPKQLVSRIAGNVTKIVQSAEVRERLTVLGVDPVDSDTDRFRAFLNTDFEKWAKVIKAAKIAVD